MCFLMNYIMCLLLLLQICFSPLPPHDSLWAVKRSLSLQYKHRSPKYTSANDVYGFLMKSGYCDKETKWQIGLGIMTKHWKYLSSPHFICGFPHTRVLFNKVAVLQLLVFTVKYGNLILSNNFFPRDNLEDKKKYYRCFKESVLVMQFKFLMSACILSYKSSLAFLTKRIKNTWKSWL